jgi:peptide/nickel transport system ATP-binding protein
MSLLSINNLNVSFHIKQQKLAALIDVSFTLDRGAMIAIVGESGAGKSLLGFSIVNLIEKPGYIESGSVEFEAKDITKMNLRQLQAIRGKRIAMIFQDPMMTLNPVMTIGSQLVESIRSHTRISYKNARNIAIKKLQLVQIASPETCFNQYPHELSGGMRQRVIIASVLLLNPDIIIADEPTTALDVTIQAEILQLLLSLCRENGVALILISHDFAVISKVAERTFVMYAGRIVEEGPTLEIINDPQHPYTQGLLNALPQMALPGQRLNAIKGNMPALNERPSGCAFHSRCPYAMPKCQQEQPNLVDSGISRTACFLVEDMLNEFNGDDEERGV